MLNEQLTQLPLGVIDKYWNDYGWWLRDPRYQQDFYNVLPWGTGKDRNWEFYFDLREAREKIRPYLDDAKFGRGGAANIEGFEKWEPHEQTVYLLWLNGCRVPFASAHDNGEEWMRLRADETNRYFALILERIKAVGNESLYQQLSEPTKRRPNEPMPKDRYEACTGPVDNDIYIYPMQGIFGYAAPRILSEIIGRREIGTAPSLYDNAIELVDSAAKETQSSNHMRSEFVARLTGKGFENGAGALRMLNHLFPRGIWVEQNCFQDYDELMSDVGIYSPKVWDAYVTAPSAIRYQHDLVDL